MTIKRIMFILVLFLSTLATGSFGKESPSTLVKTTAIIQADISENIIAYGILEPKNDKVRSLATSHAGLVKQVWVREGQRVAQGDQLVDIFISPEARMQYLQAETAVEYAKGQLKRSERLYSEKLAIKSEVENAQKNLTDSQNVLAALMQNNQHKILETLFAPMNGIVTSLNVSQGQRLLANDTTMVLASENHLVARIGIEPEQLNALTIDTDVSISPVFNENIIVKSKITALNAMLNTNTRLVDAIVSIPSEQANQLILGTQIVATFSLAPVSSMIVPKTAILSDEGGDYIFVIKNLVAQKHYIKKGSRQVNSIAISGDIKVGEKVVIEGNYVLEEGMLTREPK